MRTLMAIKYKLLKYLFCNPPYSKNIRNFASLTNNIIQRFFKKRFKKKQLTLLEQRSCDDLKKKGYSKFALTELSEKLRENIYELILDMERLGIPINGKIKDIKNKNVINLLRKSNKIKKNYKLDIDHLFNFKKIKSVINDDFFEKICNNYLKTNIVRTSYRVWLDHNYQSTNKDQETQLYHRDHRGILFVKTFIYLTDVKKNNGPFKYISYSHKKNMTSLNKISTNKDKRYSNDEVVNKLSNYEKTFLGSSGTTIMADTTGLHRGARPNADSFRVLITFIHEPKDNIFDFR